MHSQLKLKLELFFHSRDDIPLVILFGSYAHGRQTAASDVDVAVYTEKSLSVDERLNLQSEIQDFLKKSVDLVELGSAHGALLQEILVRGVIVRNHRPAIYEQLIGRMLGEKEDDGRILQKIVNLRLQ